MNKSMPKPLLFLIVACAFIGIVLNMLIVISLMRLFLSDPTSGLDSKRADIYLAVDYPDSIKTANCSSSGPNVHRGSRISIKSGEYSVQISGNNRTFSDLTEIIVVVHINNDLQVTYELDEKLRIKHTELNKSKKELAWSEDELVNHLHDWLQECRIM